MNIDVCGVYTQRAECVLVSTPRYANTYNDLSLWPSMGSLSVPFLCGIPSLRITGTRVNKEPAAQAAVLYKN